MVKIRPSGEIGRHNGLKIRRFVHSGHAGSSPASGTIKYSLYIKAHQGAVHADMVDS